MIYVKNKRQSECLINENYPSFTSQGKVGVVYQAQINSILPAYQLLAKSYHGLTREVNTEYGSH